MPICVKGNFIWERNITDLEQKWLEWYGEEFDIGSAIAQENNEHHDIFEFDNYIVTISCDGVFVNEKFPGLYFPECESLSEKLQQDILKLSRKACPFKPVLDDGQEIHKLGKMNLTPSEDAWFLDLVRGYAEHYGNSRDYQPQIAHVYFIPEDGCINPHVQNQELVTQPIINIWLGDSGIITFQKWGYDYQTTGKRQDYPIHEIKVQSGDVLIMSGESRIYQFGVKEILPGSSNLLSKPGSVLMSIRQFR
ncbi:MAG TPA: alpha-ketoglutarate-dependent dioxygenase AlkB [Nostocaceae cyanobacterium]|nr:alpha-ketoglutarate-dependent dioxygenase AlkB [Nostocaceae cyanobacterium]